MVSNDEMVLMKVVQIEKTSIKMVSAKTETTENMLRKWLQQKMILIKVEGNVKTSLKIISAKSQLSKIAEN